MYFTSFSFSTNHSSTGLLSNSNNDSDSGLLSNNSENDSAPTLLNPSGDTIFDVGSIGGKDILFGNPDISSMGSAFFASVPQTETSGSIAYGEAETIGSVAFSSGIETAGSVACAGASFSAGDSGGCGGGGFSSFC